MAMDSGEQLMQSRSHLSIQLSLETGSVRLQQRHCGLAKQISCVQRYRSSF